MPVKRKMDFNDDEQYVTQVNNNSSRPKVENKIVNRPVRKVLNEGKSKQDVDISLNRVQWTKEFMEKIRRSNERHRQKEKSVKMAENNSSDILQDRQDDGVTLGVEGLDPDKQELLDYEDDLSMEEEDIAPMIVEDSPVKAGTSRQTVEHSNEMDADRLIQQLGSQTEEKLMQNPVLQRMMKRFFEDQFKDMSKQSGKVINQPGVAGGSGDTNVRSKGFQSKNPGEQEKLIKSPSDTTIYAPALQKKLTPVSNRLINGQM